jgi:hypothetical protein
VKNITAANNNNNKEARKKKEKDRSIELANTYSVLCA